MIKVLKNATVYAPEKLGVRDILIIGSKIVKVAEHIDEYDDLPDAQIVDLTGAIVTPGLLDIHVHLTGAGGGAGFATRAPEASTAEMVKGGLTTVVGLLGTDGVSRSLENLVAKARAINEDGLTAYMLTGAYGYPSPTIFGSIEKDVALIDVCIGAKISTADQRSNNPGVPELTAIATDARRGGLLSGKAGLTIIHMGAGKAALRDVKGVVEQSDLPIKNLLPTHVTRADHLLADAVEFTKMGGTVDVTCGTNKTACTRVGEKMLQLFSSGADMARVTMTSDAYRAVTSKTGAVSYAKPNAIYKQMCWLVKEAGMALEQVLPMATTNPAGMIAKTGIKGCIAAGADADILVMDQELNITGLYALGKLALKDGEAIVKGKFE